MQRALTPAQAAGKTLRDWRLGRGYTQTELASKLNVLRPTYVNWETGGGSPRGEALVKLEELGCPVKPWIELQAARAAKRAKNAATRQPEGAAGPAGTVPPPSDGGPVDVLAEAERTLRLSTAWLADPGLTTTQRTAMLNACRGCLRDLARLREGAPIHEHPQFAALIKDLAAAVVEELGSRAPEGIEERIADRLETIAAHRRQPGSPSVMAA